MKKSMFLALILGFSILSSTYAAEQTKGETITPSAKPTDLSNIVGGNLTCYSGKNQGGRVIIRNMDSAHNCCNKGKSWACSSNHTAKNCSQDNNSHCP